MTWDTVARVPESKTWVPLEIDLAAYAGRVAYLRFGNSRSRRPSGLRPRD